MSQPDIVDCQRALIAGLRAAEAATAEAEGRARAQRQERQNAAEVQATADKEQAQKLLAEEQRLKGEAGKLAPLPPAAFVPGKSDGRPLGHLMRTSIEGASQTLVRLQTAVAALGQFRAARGRRTCLIVAAIAVVVIAVVALAAYVNVQVRAVAQVRATATAQAQAQVQETAQAQATATTQAQQAQATATAQAQQAQATATAQAQQAQAISQALGKEVPSLTFGGLQRNADWIPMIGEFDDVPMALVPAGCFMMGSEDGSIDERPVHQVCFAVPFWIDVTEVTNAQFQRLGGVAGSSSAWSEPQRPRESITWEEASAFCQRRGMRLPTEAEWEYAARGPDGLVYPWGNNFVSGNAVWNGNSGSRTWDVGSKPGGGSWVGALDMSGNVWEWANDWYGEDYYSVSPGQNPPGPTSGGNRVLRGGSWSSDGYKARAASRYGGTPGGRGDGDGFRCARSY